MTEKEFEWEAVPPHSRAGTSEEAASSMIPSAGGLRIKILSEIEGTDGLTCDEIEARLGLPHQTVSARVWELRGNPRTSNRPVLIEETGEKRVTRSGRRAIVWRAR